MLFWAIYVTDRNISFRLGHAPAIHDSDIHTPMMTESAGFIAPIVELMTFWVDCGRAQGRICAELYGPRSSSLSFDERVCIAENLANELNQIHERKSKVGHGSLH